MTKETRKKLGMAFAKGETKHYQKHYLEFKDEIDAELNPPVEKERGKK